MGVVRPDHLLSEHRGGVEDGSHLPPVDDEPACAASPVADGNESGHVAGVNEQPANLASARTTELHRIPYRGRELALKKSLHVEADRT